MDLEGCKSPGNRKSKGERTRDNILSCASQLFWKKSFHAVNTDAICQAAGINKATLYRHFPSKEALALGVIQYNFESTIDYVFEQSFAETDDPAKRLDGIYRRIYATHRTVQDAGEPCPGCPFVNMGMELATQSAAACDAVAKTQEAFAGYYGQIVRALNARRPVAKPMREGPTAQALANLMNGALVAAKLKNDPKEILNALPAAKRLVGL